MTTTHTAEAARDATNDTDTLIDRYIAQWHEADPARRRHLIEQLWAPDAVNATASFEIRGHDALDARVRATYDKWVRDAGYVFRPRHTARHHDAVRFVWDMASRADGKVVSVGVEFLLLAADGRIRADYQFIEAVS
jgi:SnoaL-like domain